MKYEFSKAALAHAARIARKSGHRKLAAVIAGRGSIEDELFAAARRGDEVAITRLLGLELKVGDRMPDGTIFAGVSRTAASAFGRCSAAHDIQRCKSLRTISGGARS